MATDLYPGAKFKMEWTCSMTRANKLLAQLRDSPKTSSRTKSLRYSQPARGKYYKELSWLSNLDGFESSLQSVREAFELELTRKRLIEKWKNRLFELNIQYGIHSILSDVELLKLEKSELAEVASSAEESNSIPLESALISMEAVKDVERKFEYKWNVRAFTAESIDQRLKKLSKELSELDDRRDRLNASSTFSIKLTPEEMSILNI